MTKRYSFHDITVPPKGNQDSEKAKPNKYGQTQHV